MSRAGERRRLLALLAGLAVASAARQTEILAEIEELEAAIAKMSAASKKALADPEVRAKMSAASKKALADPEVRAKMSAASKKAWAERHPDLAALTERQIEVYRLLRRKGCAHDEALREARRTRHRHVA